MRIAFLTNAFDKDMREASKLTVMSLAKALKKKGHYVAIISSGGNNLSKYENIEGVDVFRPYYWPCRYLAPIYHPAKIFNQLFAPILGYYRVKKKFDIVHSFSSSPILALRSIIPKVLNKKIAAVHSIKSFSKYGGKKTRSFRYLNYLDGIITNLNVIKNYLIKGKVNSAKIKVIRSNIDETNFYVMSKEKLKLKYGYSKNKVILYYGPLTDRKGVRYLISAFALLCRKNSSYKLVLACKNAVRINDHINQVKKQMNVLKIGSDCVDFVKFGVPIAEYVNLADVVVMPYPELIGTEGNPSCILESMACGTPVVTSDLPELIEFLNQDLVYFAKAKDYKSIASKIDECFNSKEKTKKMAAKSLEYVKIFFTAKICEEHIRYYEKLIEIQRR